MTGPSSLITSHFTRGFFPLSKYKSHSTLLFSQSRSPYNEKLYISGWWKSSKRKYVRGNGDYDNPSTENRVSWGKEVHQGKKEPVGQERKILLTLLTLTARSLMLQLDNIRSFDVDIVCVSRGLGARVFILYRCYHARYFRNLATTIELIWYLISLYRNTLVNLLAQSSVQSSLMVPTGLAVVLPLSFSASPVAQTMLSRSSMDFWSINAP